jgi:hypothetical protein
VHEGKTLLYRASKLDCDVCPLKPQCCPKDPSRKIPRDIHEHARDVARSLVSTEGFEQSRRERKKIEMRFAHLKRILKLVDFDCVDHEVPRMNLSLLPSPRTCDGSHRSSHDRHLLELCASRSARIV